jgi:tRNA-Thr(GGU) m(6)t(6)A37 methyltransferase TsaA
MTMTAHGKDYEDRDMKLRPIGVVRNSVTEVGRHDWDDVVSELVMSPELEEALSNVEEFSHIIVLFWMHKVPDLGGIPMRVHPRRRLDLPMVGLFATRAPTRPNPLGLGVVKLLERRGNILVVEGLDAVDGTPIVDIKPYLTHRDSPRDARMPEWMTRPKE